MDLKAVIFDFGGVLVRTADQEPRIRWQRALGLTRDQLEGMMFGAETEYAVQLGRFDEDEHWRWVGARLGLDIGQMEALRSEFFSRDVLDTGLMDYIARLRAHFHIGLLSNWSRQARVLLAERYPIAGCFDSVTISAEEGVMKPDERIYRIALARAGAVPAEAVFVDDFLRNVQAARTLGLHGVHFTDTVSAMDQLAALTGMQ